MTYSFYSNSSDQTTDLGKAMGKLFKGGELIGITGELGAGKTTFIQGLADGIGIGQDQYVRSPSFTIINEYKGPLTMYHFDLYRLSTHEEILDLGYQEYLGGDGVTVIEWFEKMEDFFKGDLLRLNIEVKNGDSRILKFSCKGVYYRQILKNLF